MSADHERCGRKCLACGQGEDPSSLLERGGVRPLLVGDNIENPGNAESLRAAAELFDWDCGFLYDARHPGAQTAVGMAGARLIAGEALAGSGLPIIALDNVAGAEDLFRMRAPPGRFALIVGNERKGISRDVLRVADRAVQIPMASARINTVNVAAAAAIALHHLSRGGGARPVGRGALHGRPEILLVAPTDAIELGSVVRSAAGFGWERLFVDDRHGVWFDTDRVTRSLGRGAARRGRNPIRVIPARGGGSFAEVCVIGARADGEPLQRADLAGGSEQLVVIADEGGSPGDGELLQLGRRVRHLRLETEPAARRPFRLIASIALAEIARRSSAYRPGIRAGGAARPHPTGGDA